MAILNLGVLAHVDAGKTSLTERILFDTGVISVLGRVDHGTTRTDTLSLERQRGITIQSAVASFVLGDLTVNLVDTPGHPDFIAEVDRALQVLDAVVVVVSAVEGVQPQTHRLVQAVRAAGLPLLIFVNKIDRGGAQGTALVAEIARSLGLTAIALSTPVDAGSREATVAAPDFDDPAFVTRLVDTLAEVDDTIVGHYVAADGRLTPREVRAALRRAVGGGRLAPVFFGSAMTGAGVGCLLAELPRLVRAPGPAPGAAASAIVFKMQRAPTGEKIALARLFGGALAVRDQITIRRPGPNGAWAGHAARLTGLERFQGGTATTVTSAAANDIVRIHGPRDIRVGDVIGAIPARRRPPRFPRPTLESVIRPQHDHDAGRMFAALSQLEEQDPLIDIRRGTREATVSVRLYGEVQKEVIQATLADEFAVGVEFEPSQVICIERVIGRGEAREEVGEPGNPFLATVGLRIEPAPPDSGIGYHQELGALPLAFYRAIEETVFATLEEGLRGWPVPDCRVTLTGVGMTPVTAAGDFRKLVPLVLMTALQDAGTEVCEPIVRFTLDLPPEVLGEAFVRLNAAGATLEDTVDLGDLGRISGVLAAAAVDRFERQVPDLTGGRGVFRTEAAGHRPVPHDPPIRRRTDFDPLHRKRYLALVSQH